MTNLYQFFFKFSSSLKIYKTIKKETEDESITDIGNKAVVEYLIGRNFFMIPKPDKNPKLSSIESIIYENDDFIPFKYL